MTDRAPRGGLAPGPSVSASGIEPEYSKAEIVTRRSEWGVWVVGPTGESTVIYPHYGSWSRSFGAFSLRAQFACIRYGGQRRVAPQ